MCIRICIFIQHDYNEIVLSTESPIDKILFIHNLIIFTHHDNIIIKMYVQLDICVDTCYYVIIMCPINNMTNMDAIR
jgi:hypothetical protein